jgi:hypothetical protein
MLVCAAMFAVSEFVHLDDHGACREMGRWNNSGIMQNHPTVLKKLRQTW